MKPADRFADVQLSLIRQINALATPLSVNLGIGEPNLEPDETLREMAARAARQPWQYSANAGFMSLRKKIAEGIDVDPKAEICVTAGTEEALYALFQAFVNPGDEVLIPDPGFVSYPALAKLAGGETVTYELEAPSWRLNPKAIEAKLTKRTKLIVVNSPSNPLGAVADRDALQAVAELADQHGCLVLSDEIYREIWYDEEPPSMLGMGKNVIIANGLSKSHGMTGLRLGWLIARAELMDPIVRSHQYVATCASVFSQSLAEEVFSNETWNASWLQSVRSQFTTQRGAALHSIERELEAKIEPPEGAFYAFVPVPSCDTVGFAKTLATDAAVLVIPGVAFGPAGEGFVRVSFAASLDRIGTGIERIGRWLRASGR